MIHSQKIHISWFKVDIGPKKDMWTPKLSPIMTPQTTEISYFFMHYMYVSHVLYVCITAKGSRTGAVLEPFLASDYDVLRDRPFRASLMWAIMNTPNTKVVITKKQTDKQTPAARDPPGANRQTNKQTDKQTDVATQPNPLSQRTQGSKYAARAHTPHSDNNNNRKYTNKKKLIK